MKKVISIKFKTDGRKYYFDPGDLEIKPQTRVIVETANGLSVGTVFESVHEVEEKEIVSPLQRVVRVATEEDLARDAENRLLEKEALGPCEKMIAELGLEMRLVSAEYSFERNRITFFFTADNRVDFRELVKKLAAHFHARIQLFQIGVRDEARLLGGIGVCGQPFCCRRLQNALQPVSVKMAKEQGLPINPASISGTCGRLMCCLTHEQEAYEYLNKITPPVGATVKINGMTGTVVDANPISGNLLVRSGNEGSMPIRCKREEVEIISRRRQPAKPKANDETAQ